MKRGFLTFLLGVVCLCAGAQRYPFIRPLPFEYPGGEDGRTAGFYEKLDRLANYGEGDVSIVQIGGSHIQAGSWSGRMRNRLLSLRYGLDGGRGLVFPFAAAATNTPFSYRSEVTGVWTWTRCLESGEGVGASGLVASTADTTATVLIDLDREKRDPWEPSFTFRSVDLIGTGSMEPLLVVGRDTLYADSFDAKSGIRHYELPHYASWFKLVFSGPGKEFSIRGFYLDRPGGGLTYNGLGVNGASTNSWASCTNFESEMKLLRPDLVIFCIGINDLQGTEFQRDRFMRNHRELIKRIRRANPDCALLFVSPTDSYYRRRYPNTLCPEAVKACRDLAAEYKAPFWDLFEVMGGLGSIEKWNEATLASGDLVHFNRSGYYLIGDMMFKALRGDWAEHGK